MTMVRRFYDEIMARGVRSLNIETEAMPMRDFAGYSIGPHTDSPKRLITMMVYLSEDSDHGHVGRSFYAPKDPFTLAVGHTHHGFDKFEQVGAARYLPNSAFGFLRSDNSFHGVTPMQDEYQRDTVVYIVRHKQAA